MNWAGIEVVSPLDGRTLTVLAEEPDARIGSWTYVCSHCAKVGTLPTGDRGYGGGVLEKLRAVARRPCVL